MGKYNTRGANRRIQRNVVMKENYSNTGSDVEISTGKENKRGRKVSKTSVEFEKEAKRIKKNNNSHDFYCWKCKKIESEIECLPEVECSNCVRAFHTSCIEGTKIDKDKICYVCQQQSITKTTLNIDDERILSKLLLHIIETACPLDKREYEPIANWQDSNENEKLINIKDLCCIHDKCNEKGCQYESHVELEDDLEWICHNCKIVYGDKSPNTKNAKKIFLKVKRMLKDALDCPECYIKKIENNKLTFLSICKTPHPLVWAKVKGYSYWPAKCLKASKEKASVRFFHTHQIGSVPLSNVLSMSEVYPSGSKLSGDFLLATNELKAYIDIFEGYYGKFPFAPKDSSFDFEKEEKVMNELSGHSRVVISADTFPPSPIPEPRSYLPVVDLTEDGEDQTHQKENVAPIILHQALEANLFEQDIPIATSNDDSNENILGNQKDLQAFHQAISGSLLPSQLPDNSNISWLTPGISISNVISGTDVPSNAELLAEVATCDTEHALQNANFSMSMSSSETDLFQITPVLSQNSISSSSTEICLRNVNNYSRSNEAGNFVTRVVPSNAYLEDDGEIQIIEEITPSTMKRSTADVDSVLQSILKHDPRSYDMLKKANALVKELFIQFWGTTTLNKPERIIQAQADEIQALRQLVSEMKQEMARIKSEKLGDKLKNAGNIVRLLRAEVKSLEEQHKKYTEKRDQDFKKLWQDNERLSEEIKKLKRESDKQAEDFEKRFEKQERLFNERIKEAKTNKYCDVVECFQLAKHLCCYSGVRAYSYCSEKCKAIDDVHRRTVCKAAKRIDPQQLPDEREDATSDQVVARELLQQRSTISSITYTYASIQQHTNKEITSSSSSPQTNSANIHQSKKVVAAKKTFELAKNINRSSNADIF